MLFLKTGSEDAILEDWVAAVTAQGILVAVGS